MPKIASLSVQIEGQGSPLLLVHGFGISFNIWSRLLPHLAPHFTLVIPELPGIGRSDLPPAHIPYARATADRLLRLREELGFSAWDVLGYSIGSRISEFYIHQDRGAVRRVILLCPLQTHPLASVGLRLGLWLDRHWPRTGDFILTGWRINFLVRLLGFNLRPSPLAAHWVREITSCRRETLKHTLCSLPRGSTQPFSLGEVPTLLVWGRYDLIAVPPRRPGPQDRLVNTDHSAPVSAAREVTSVILPFLLETSAEMNKPMQNMNFSKRGQPV